MRQLRGAEVVSEGSIVTCNSKYMERARPITSKPGPMLAEEQGARIVNLEAAMVRGIFVLRIEAIQKGFKGARGRQ